LDLVIPFDLDLGSDVTIHADLLVKNFGCPNGMIVVKEYAAVKTYLAQIDALDYGFSVLDGPLYSYDRATMIEMLSEWGWTGPMAETPSWIIASEC
jgi:hypothetical protein